MGEPVKGSLLTLPLPCGGRECGQQNLWAITKRKHHPSGWCFLFGMSRAGLNSRPRPARSALNQEVRQGSCEWLRHSWDAGSESSLVARSKKERHPHGCLSFLEQHFCYAKVTACGRVIEREWGNPSKVPPSHSPLLAVGGSAGNKTCGQPRNPIRKDGVFLYIENHSLGEWFKKGCCR